MDSRLTQVLKSQKRPPLNALALPFVPQESAVLALLTSHGGEDALVFTKRTEHVAHHKGQICFPGGVWDATDKDLWATALRETHEEIGVQAECVSQLGELGQVLTPTGFRITPFLGRLHQPVEWCVSATEIAEIFTVPVSHLLEPTNLTFRERVAADIKYIDPVFTYGTHQIWGATGRILLDFLEVWKSVR